MGWDGQEERVFKRKERRERNRAGQQADWEKLDLSGIGKNSVYSCDDWGSV